MMKNILLIVSLLTIYASSLLAQDGIITGKVTDADTGEELIGANVIIKGTTNGAPTDIDGNYRISVEPGTYDLQCSYVSYETKTVTGIEVKAGQTTIMNITIGSSSELEEIVITGEQEKNTEVAMLRVQKNSSLVLDAISSQQFKKLGDNNAAAAIRRVPGVSVAEGKFIVLRGLSDRYSRALLNNVEIPSLDPDRNAVQLDLFPSNLIDNMTVYKTFSPDLPGDMTGGLLDITTKDFPESFTLYASSSFGFNTNTTFNDSFLTYEGSDTDWLGFDSGDRNLPASASLLPFNSPTTPSNAVLDEAAAGFNGIFEPETKSPFLSQRHALSIGNQFDLFGRPFGFVIGLNYQSDFQFYENGNADIYDLVSQTSSEVDTRQQLIDSEGQEDVLVGVLANLSYKFSDNHKLSFNFIRNQNGTSTTRRLDGFTDDIGEGFSSSLLRYTERSMNFFKLGAEHYFPNLFGGTKIDWHSSYTRANQDEPDFRLFAFNELGSGFEIRLAAYPGPIRFYRELTDNNYDNKINVTIPYKLFGGLDSKLKLGFSYLSKDREFVQNRYDIRTPTGSLTEFFNGSISDFFNPNNFGITPSGDLGVVYLNNSEERNAYDATQTVIAGYLMTDLQISEKLKARLGARLEVTNIEVESRDSNLPTGDIQETDILPAVNFTYEIVENMNVRASYSRTLARPTFREIAPFTSFEFIGGFDFTGNPLIQRSLINNFDLRWETFPRSGEIISFSAFLKLLQDPIERSFNADAINEITVVNVDNATVLGGELEFRKRLDFITPALRHFSLGVNFSYIFSEVNLPDADKEIIIGNGFTPDESRPLFGQSPFLLNNVLSYNNPDIGLDVTISHNVFGERIAIVTRGPVPNVFEKPRNTLNISLRKSFGVNQQWKVTARANNILNPEYNFQYDFNDQDLPFRKYKLGVDFSLGVSYTFEK